MQQNKHVIAIKKCENRGKRTFVLLVTSQTSLFLSAVSDVLQMQ